MRLGTAPLLVATSVLAGLWSPTLARVTGRFCNRTPVAGVGDGTLAPYPSSIAVSGLGGRIVDVNVTLFGLTTGRDSAGGHWTEDLDVVVSAPDRSTAVVMSDAGGDNINPSAPVTGADLVFDDEAPLPLPPDTPVTAGTYRPIDDDDDYDDLLPGHLDVWPVPAPPTEQVASLSALGSGDPNGTWSLWAVDDNVYQRAESFTGGWCIDITTGPVPADLDGDGDTDVSVFRPTDGTWLVDGGPMRHFGTPGDIPVPGDYDGDGTTDVAVYRPSSGYWFVAGGAVTQFGTSGDIPVPGDYDGDGSTDVAVFRPHGGYWFVAGGAVTQFGTSGDIPVPGDYDGDGSTDVAVFRPSSGYWFVAGGAVTQFGTSGDFPVPGDYDGDRTTDVAVFRPHGGYWFVAGGAVTQFGTGGDIPVPGDYDGDGTTDVAVFRPKGGYWFVAGGAVTQFGTGGDLPLPLPEAVRRFFASPA